MSRSFQILGLLVALTALAPAHAAPLRPSVDERAEDHVAAAKRAFRAGRYDRALAELEVGYAIEPRREFLIAFAQVYAAMGRTDQAIDRCQRYLALAPASPLAASVRQLVRDLRRRPAPVEPAAAPVEPTAAPVEPAPPPPAPARKPAPRIALQPIAATAATEPAPAAPIRMPPAPRHHRRVTWALIGGAAVVVLGVGIGLGVGLGLRDHTPATTLGNVPFQ